MIKNSIQSWGWGAFRSMTVLGLGLAVLSSGARASSTSEIVVRYRYPQNNLKEALKTTWNLSVAAGATRNVELLNSEEGLVKISFGSEDAKAAAIARLSRSKEVLNIAPNLTYKPALSLKFREAARKADPVPEPEPEPETILGFLSELVLGREIPAVQLPVVFNPGLDPMVDGDWALKNIRMPEAPAVQNVPWISPVITAVIDTGVDYNHEDLIGAMWRNPDNDREVGRDFAHDRNEPFDVVQFDIEGCLKDPICAIGLDTSKYLVNPGHGTHCAGHVGAVVNNSLGLRGVGAGTQIMGLKFFYDVGEAKAGQGDDAAAIKAIDYAIKNGARVISASWGGRTDRKEAEASELKQAFIRAQKAGVLVVIAAGNDGVDQDTVEDPSYPAAYDLDNLIVVAATDQKDQLAGFSSYGAKSVHVAAPGVKILSTVVGSGYSDIVGSYKGRDGKTRTLDWDGTSMATPIVAGAVAALWAKYPEATYTQIRNHLLKTARSVPDLRGKVATGAVLDVTNLLDTPLN